MAKKPTYEELQQKVNKSGIIRKSIMHACFLLVVTICVFICPPAYAGKKVVQTDYKYKILILNSYHKGFEWTDGQVSAATEVLTTNLKNPALYVEYMDTKRIYNEEYLGLFYEALRLKYRNVKFNAIITTDDNALMFVLKHHKALFDDVPVVFCGINGYSDTLLAGRTLFTGMIEVLDIIPTIDLALKLHPGTRKIVVVNDSTHTGMWIRKEVKAAIPHYRNIQFEFLKGEELTTEELLEKLRLLPNDNIVLNTVWLRDKAKIFISTHDGVSLISSNSTVPVYGLFGNHMGNGIIGGKLLYSKIHGKIAAEMVVRILRGERPNDIPVLMESANPFMFDYEQLDRWNIKVSDLPENSDVINKPFSLYEEYKYRIWSVIAAFLIFSVTVFILTRNILMRSKAEEALRRSKKELSIRNKIAQVFLTISEDEIYGEVLEFILKAMKSKYGVFGYIDENGALVCPSMTRSIWTQCQVSDKDIIFPLDTWDGIWGKALIEKKTFYSNEPFSVPQGHIPVFNALDVPIIYKGEVIGNFLVGNKKTDYTEEDKQLLETIVSYIAPILNNKLQKEREERRRKQAEKQIKSSLKEKEVLLSEIHHRVKNNMQVIISLLRLRADKIEDKKHADMFKEGEDRIRSMSLVHEQLYQSKDFANIDFGEYIKSLANGLFTSYGVDTNKIKLNIENKDVSFDLENAIPCGLIINELVSNSLKHAFPQQGEGNISIVLQSINEDEFELTVSDDGVGIPEALDVRDTESMGLHLIRVLAEQTLEGKMELNREEGTRFHFLFKRAKYRPRI